MFPNINLSLRKKECFVFLMIITGLTLGWIAFYPGFMSLDSRVQYEMSQSLQFTDWHPPVMSWVWSKLNFIFPGPSGMLAFHLVLLWAAIYVWWENFKNFRLAWLFLLIPFLPWVLNFQGVLWKDVGMAFSLLLLSGLAMRRPSFGNLVLALALVFYALNVRFNAIFAVLPIVALLSYCWLDKPTLGKVSACMLLTLLFAFAAGSFLSYSVLKSEKTKPSNFMMIDDLVYLSVKNNESFIPGMRLDELQSCAKENLGGSTLVARIACLLPLHKENQVPLLDADLTHIWMTTITKHPIQYLQFRLAAFSYLLRSPNDPPYYIWHPGIDKNSQGLEQIPNSLTKSSEKFVNKTAEKFPFLFKPYWWVILTLCLFFATFTLESSKTVRTAQALLISSALYILGYLPTTPMADFRYVYWSVIATTLAYLILMIERPRLQQKMSYTKKCVIMTLIIFSAVIVYHFHKIVQWIMLA